MIQVIQVIPVQVMTNNLKSPLKELVEQYVPPVKPAKWKFRKRKSYKNKINFIRGYMSAYRKNLIRDNITSRFEMAGFMDLLSSEDKFHEMTSPVKHILAITAAIIGVAVALMLGK